MSQSKLPRGARKAARFNPATQQVDLGGGDEPAPRPSPKPRRKYLTKNQYKDMAAAQSHKCGCGCGRPLSTEKRGTVAEHTSVVALGNGEKPDHIRNRACAKRKTYGGRDGAQWSPVGGDIRDIAHIKRLRDGKTQHDTRLKKGAKLKGGRKLQSRNDFKASKYRRRMDGTVEVRAR